MKVLILGRTGQVGFELARAVWPEGIHGRALGRSELDLSRPDQIASQLSDVSFDLLVNAAAYTAVDKAETEQREAFTVNSDAPAALAEECAARDVPMIHFSTDYVFDGCKPSPYVENDAVAPINVYGASKSAGEQAVRKSLRQHIILRTSWVYGSHGQNFVKSMLRLAEQRDKLRIVNDQRGCPTNAADIAGAILHIAGLLARDGELPWGTYHYAGQGETTWYDFANLVLDANAAHGGKRPETTAIRTSDYPLPARRPSNSCLDCSHIAQTLGLMLRPWQDACREVVHACVSGEIEVTS